MLGLDTALNILVGLVAIGVTVLIAAVPWAYSMHGRLTRVEVNTEPMTGLVSDLKAIEKRVTIIEARTNPALLT